MLDHVTFIEMDTTDEIVREHNKLVDNINLMETKIEQLSETQEVQSGVIDRLNATIIRITLPKKKAEKPKKPKRRPKPKKKGSAPMKMVVALVILALAMFSLCYVSVSYAAYVPTDINYDIASNPDTLAIYLRDCFANITGDSYLFTPTTTAPTVAEGKVYYDNTANSLMLSTDGSSWTAVSSAAGNSLDNAYDLGNGVTVDGTAITLTTPNAANNIVLALVQNEADNDNAAMTITMGTNAIGSALTINSQTGGTDITGDNFTINQAGAFSGVGITTTSGELLVTTSDVLFDDTYDVAWDTSADMLIFQDNAVLGIGGAHDGAADMTFKGDGTDVLLEVATEDAADLLIGSTNALDVKIHAATNTTYWLFNSDDTAGEMVFEGVDLMMMDDDIIVLGDSDDFQIYYEETTTDNLIFKTAAANDAVQIGDGTTGTDLKLMGNTSGDYANWDNSADELYFEDADLKLNEGAQLEFCSTDDATDWTIDLSTAERLTFTPSETDDTSTFHIGTAANTSDVLIYGKTASELITWDASEDSLTVVADLSLFTMTGTTAPFKVDATGTVAGFATILETTDGGIQLNADGADNGDITIDAADILTLTSADIKMHDGAATEIWHIEGTADGFEHILSFTDATADITWTFPDGGTDILAVMGSTLATNYPEVANSVTGGTNQLIFEGSDADTEETVITATDPTADNTFTLPAAFSGNFMIAGTNSEIYSAVVEVTAAQIKDLAANPKELVAAPGAGYGLKLLSLLLVLDNGGVNYDDAAADGNMYVCYVDGAGLKATGAIEGDAFIDCAADFIIAVEPVALAATAATSIDNDALVLDNDGAEYTTGDGTMTVFITYAVVNLGL